MASNAVSTRWSQVSGPSTASFGSISSPATSVTTPSFGNYCFRLLANNGSVQTFDDIWITATPSNPFETWQNIQFPTDPNGLNSQPLADPDYDGSCNLLEFAQGSNPNSNDSTIKGIQTSTGINGPIFSFRRRSGSGTGSTESGYTLDGITYTLKASTSLSSPSWQSGSSVIQQVGTPVNNGDGTETVTVRLLGGNPNAFLKMEITLP